MLLLVLSEYDKCFYNGSEPSLKMFYYYILDYKLFRISLFILCDGYSILYLLHRIYIEDVNNHPGIDNTLSGDMKMV